MSAASVQVPVVDLTANPGGPRIRQMLAGTPVTVLRRAGDDALVRGPDDYEGWADATALSDPIDVTHRVAVAATLVFPREDFKSMGKRVNTLSFGARTRVLDERQKFFETDRGFIPKKHLRPLDRLFADPATVAQLHFGVPYLWGGNSSGGIDCSGLVQAALSACDIACPGDSGPQREALGHDVTGEPQRGDLVFWKGHVGMMVDAETLIHANAHHMATAYEPINAAILRIEAQGDGPVLRRARL